MVSLQKETDGVLLHTTSVRLLTIEEGDDTIPHVSLRKQTPPSSSGPGRSPLKAQTGVRVPLGAHSYFVSMHLPTVNLLRGMYRKF